MALREWLAKFRTARRLRCVERLRARATRDRVLGTADERPLLDRTLDELGNELTDADRRLEKQAGELRSSVGARLDATVEALNRLEKSVHAAFAAIAQPGASPAAACADAGQHLEEAVTKFGAGHGARLRAALDLVHPDKHLARGLLDRLGQLRESALRKLPDQLYLIEPKHAGVAHIPGRSLVSARIVPQLDQLCGAPFRSRWRLRRLRRQLRRDYHLTRVPLRHMGAEALVLRSELAEKGLQDRHAALHARLVSALTDAWRGLRYQLEVASVELEELGRSAAEPPTDERIAELKSLSSKALDKAREALGTTRAEYTQLWDEIGASISEDHRNALATIARGIVEAHTLEGRLRWGLKSLQKNFERRAESWRRGLLAAAQEVRAGVEHAGRRGQALAMYLRERIVPVPPRLARLALTEIPSPDELEQHAATLPPIYRRLFSREPLTNSEFLVAREDELGILRTALARWLGGSPTSVLLAGGAGTGKTSLLNCFEAELPEEIKTVRITLDHRLRDTADVLGALAAPLGAAAGTSPDDLVTALRAGPRRIVILEQTHYIYLRALGTRDTAMTLLQILLATRANILWLVACREGPHARLRYLHGLDDFFTHVIQTRLHDAGELREAVLRRQRATGDPIRFLPPEMPERQLARLLLTNAPDSKPVQTALEDDYFETLYRTSGGNISATLYIWLITLTRDAAGAMCVKPCPVLDARVITSLPRETLFTLGEIIGHGALGTDEHADIFQTGPDRSRRSFEQLISLRLLAGTDGHRSFEVHPVFEQTVARSLRDMNILH